jgi:cytochrome P450
MKKARCENVSFGAGPHPCTGAKFAMLNVKNIAFNLMAHYDVTVRGKAEN